VDVNAERARRSACAPRPRFGEVAGEHAAVGIAEAKDVGAGGWRLRARAGKGGVGGVAVEEVLGVEDDSLAVLLEVMTVSPMSFRFSSSVMPKARRVEVPGLAEDGNYGGRTRSGATLGSCRRGSWQSGGAEGGEPGVLELKSLARAKKFLVARIRAGPSRLDVVDAELVQRTAIASLSSTVKRYGFPGTVAEGGLESGYVI